MFFTRNSIIFNNINNTTLHEDENDDMSIDASAPETAETEDNTSNDTNDSTETPDNNNDTSDDSGDNMDIDANLDDDSGDSDDDMGGDDTGSDDSSMSSSPEETEEEPVKANTDIFADLSKEEQSVKIEELKQLYSDLYSSVDDFIRKINDIDPDENNVRAIKRCSNTLYNLKRYISDYLLNLFPIKSYIENDVEFNRFLTILNSVANVINDISKTKEK